MYALVKYNRGIYNLNKIVGLTCSLNIWYR